MAGTAREPVRRASANDGAANAPGDRRAATTLDPGEPAPRGGDAMLALQRQIGNRATRRLLERTTRIAPEHDARPTRDMIITLQRKIGNRATQRLIGRETRVIPKRDASPRRIAPASPGVARWHPPKPRLQPKRVALPDSTPSRSASSFPIAARSPVRGAARNTLQRTIVGPSNEGTMWAQIERDVAALEDGDLKMTINYLQSLLVPIPVSGFDDLVGRIAGGAYASYLPTSLTTGLRDEKKLTDEKGGLGATEGSEIPMLGSESSDEELQNMLLKSGYSWKKIKAKYVPKPVVMRQLLALRDRIWRDLFATVKSQLGRDTTLSAAERLAVSRLDTLFFGSADLTSDVDLTVVCPVDNDEVGARVEVLAVTLFNSLFRGRFGREPGTVLDVNLYARDFLPIKIAAVKREADALAKRLADSKNPEEQKALKGQIEAKQAETGAITESAASDESWLQTEQSKATTAGINDTMSLVKIRRYLPTQGAWDAYVEQTVGGIQDVAVQQQTRARFAAADTTWKSIEGELNRRIVELGDMEFRADAKATAAERERAEAKQAETLRARDEDAEMEASNRLYEETLQLVLQLGARIAALRRKIDDEEMITTAQQARLDLLIENYIRTKTKSLVLANESYHTGAALKDVLLKQQGRVKTPDWTSRGYAVDLTSMDWLQSINEQAGFCAEQLLHTEGGRGFWKAAKYMDRIIFDLQQIRPAVPLSAEMKQLDAVQKPLKAIKGDASLAEAAKDTAATQEATRQGFTSQAALNQLVLTVSSQANIAVRTPQPAPAPASTSTAGSTTPSGPSVPGETKRRAPLETKTAATVGSSGSIPGTPS